MLNFFINKSVIDNVSTESAVQLHSNTKPSLSAMKGSAVLKIHSETIKVYNYIK